MTKKESVKTFENTRNNCCQAILLAFGAAEDLVNEAKKWGGGRASEGICGALYGAMLLCGSDNVLLEKCKSDFAEKTGSILCKEVREAKVTSCTECVGIAAEWLEENGFPK